MFSFLAKFKLYTQIAIVSALLLATFIFISVGINIRQQQISLSEELESQGYALARSLSSTLNYLVITDKFDVIEEVLLKSAEFPNVRSLKIVTQQGQKLGHVIKNNSSEISIDYSSHSNKLPGFLVNKNESLSFYKDEILHIWYPLKTSSLLGWLNINISLEKLQVQRTEVIYKNIIGAIIAVVLDVIILVVVLIIPTRKLNRAIRVAQQLDAEIPCQVTDSGGSYEINQLINALNGAARRLGHQKIEIDGQTEELKDNNLMLAGITQTQSIMMSDVSNETAFHAIMDAMLQFSGCEVAMLLEYNESSASGYLNILAISHTAVSFEGCHDLLDKNSRAVSLNNNSILGRVVESKEGIFSNLVSSDYFLNINNNWLCEISSFLGIPLLHEGSLTGVLVLCNLDRSQAPGSLESKFSPYTVAVSNLILNHRAHLESRKIFERNKLILDSTSEGIYGIDTKGCISFVNPAACRILGYSEDELMYCDIEALVQHSHADGTKLKSENKNFIKSMNTGETKRFVKDVFWHKDGNRLPVAYTCTPVFANGINTGAIVTFIDLSDLASVEDALRLSQERFDRAVNGANDGLWECDLKQYEVWCSSRLNTLMDIGSESSIIPVDSLLIRIHPDDTYLLLPFLDATTITDDKFDLNCRVLTGSGLYKWLRIRGSVYRDKEETAIRIAGSMMDISEQVRIDKMKDEFVSTVSHELRTPLSSIIGALGLLRGGAVGEMDETASSMITIAHRNGERLLGIINDILDMAKIESGEVQMDLLDVNLPELLHENIEVNQMYALEHHAVLEMRSHFDEAWVSTDELRLNQVMSNLISNAIKFSGHEGHVQVALSLRNEHYRIAVQDNGPGIDKAYEPYLFKKFTQEQSSLTRNVGGTGLGLAISKGYVEQLGGLLTYETSPSGTTFYVDLPMRCSNETSQNMQSNSA